MEPAFSVPASRRRGGGGGAPESEGVGGGALWGGQGRVSRDPWGAELLSRVGGTSWGQRDAGVEEFLGQ